MKVIICGAGIMGCKLAYHLTLRGVTPTVVERCSVACAASGKAGGFLARDWCDHGPVGPLAQVSYRMHEELAQTFPECDFRTVDTHQITFREGSGKRKKDLPDWLDQPLVSHGKIGDKSNTAQVHPRKLTEALMKAAEEKGAKLVIGEVQGIQLDEAKGKVQGVKVSGKVIEADVAVITMGPWSAKAAEWLPIPVIRGQRAHSIILRPGEPVTADALFTESSSLFTRQMSPEVYPRPDGDVYVCGVSDEVPLPDDPSQIHPNTESCKSIHRTAGLVSSRLAEAPLIKEQACYLPLSPDGVPLIGKVPGVEGAYIAAGHSCWGILNGPGTGAALSQLITEGKCSMLDLSHFDPARFK